MPKIISKKPPKISQLKIEKLLFMAHPLASSPYLLFCDFCHNQYLNTKNVKADSQIIRLIKTQTAYYFFDNFDYASSLQIGDIIFARFDDCSDEEIINASWNALFDCLLNIQPINPDAIRRFIHSVPDKVMIDKINGRLTIVAILGYLGVNRAAFDYQDKKISSLPKYQGMPNFNELIGEVLHERF